MSSLGSPTVNSKIYFPAQSPVQLSYERWQQALDDRLCLEWVDATPHAIKQSTNEGPNVHLMHLIISA